MTDPTGYDPWRRPDRTITWLIVQVRFRPKSELNCHDRLDRMRSIAKTRQDNDVIDHKGVIFIEYDTKLLRPNGHCAVYDEDQTRNDLIDKVCFTLKTKPNCYDQSKGVWSMMTKRHDNGVIDCKGIIYAKIRAELWWSIRGCGLSRKAKRTTTWLTVQVWYL